MIGIGLLTASALWGCATFENYELIWARLYGRDPAYGATNFSFIGFFAAVVSTFLAGACVVRQEYLLLTKRCNIF